MGSNAQSQWLVTGASQGLGFEISMAALKAGHKVLAGARNPEKAAETHPELEKAGGKWFKLDVTSPDTAQTVAHAVKEAGGIDVLVNNAGYFLAGNIEDVQEEEMQKIWDTNFFGAIRVLKGVLPTMRAQKSGTIVVIGSIFGLYACPGGAMYSCTKAALDMLYETLKVELKTFNIRSVVVAAGIFRTSILNNAPLPSQGFSEHYLGTAIGKLLGDVQGMMQEPEQHIAGDPTKFGPRVVDIVDGKELAANTKENLRVFIGRDTVSLLQDKIESLKSDMKSSEEISTSTDHEGSTAAGVSVVAGY